MNLRRPYCSCTSQPLDRHQSACAYGRRAESTTGRRSPQPRRLTDPCSVCGKCEKLASENRALRSALDSIERLASCSLRTGAPEAASAPPSALFGVTPPRTSQALAVRAQGAKHYTCTHHPETEVPFCEGCRNVYYLNARAEGK